MVTSYFVESTCHAGKVFTIGRNQDNRLGVGSYQPPPNEEHWREMQFQEVQVPVEDGEKPSPVVHVTARAGTAAIVTADGLMSIHRSL